MSNRDIKALDEFLTSKFSDEQLTEFVRSLAFKNQPTDRTVSTRYSNYKKYLRDNVPSISQDLLAELNPPSELTASIISNNKERLNSKKIVRFDQNLVDRLFELRDSTNVFDNLISLQFLSGRRINEIFDAKMKGIPKKTDRLKMILSKKKEDGFNTVRLINNITSAEFRKELASARRKLMGIELNDLTNRINKRLKSTVRKDLSSHSLRGLYATYMYETQNPENQALVGFVSDILGHASQSDSGVNYSNYVFGPPSDSAQEDEV